jgi:cytochrome c oxidase subunit 3
VWAHTFLDTELGAINTVVLLCSSLTMAWAVRAAQLGQRRLLVWLLALTLAGGFGFMGIKFVEYKAKFEHGLLWAGKYHPEDHRGADHAASGAAGQAVDHEGEAAPGNDAIDASAEHGGSGTGPTGEHADAGAGTDASASAAGASPVAPRGGTQGGVADPTSGPPATEAGPRREASLVGTAARGPAGLAVDREPGAHGAGEAPANAQVFFSIYFLMTGLHGLHVLAGMGAIAWVMVRAARGAFGPTYFTPVDLVGLYWHLVDLIWIFLFPLLYLIH